VVILLNGKAEVTYRKIEITRKTRIMASERLRKWDMYGNFMTVYYSTFIVGLSIWNFKTNNQAASVFLLISSTVLAILTLWVNSQRFGERSNSFKHHYIELARLSASVQGLPDDCANAELSSIEDTYLLLLGAVENHKECDYLRALRAFNSNSGCEKFSQPLTCRQKADLFISTVKELVLVLSLLVLPVILVLRVL
jgi:hypothetical protein